jgi:hypothetical protein
MNRKFYTLMLAPLLFVACSNNQPQATTQKEAPAPKVEKKSAPKEVVTAPSFKYIKDTSVLQSGMLHIKGFIGTLKPTLKSMLQQDPSHVTAMGACTNMAPKMKEDYNSKTTDVKIRRTALKYRNPANKPDSVDQEVMYRLQAQNDKKPLVIDMGNKHYRVYKPLQIEKPCLICHGNSKNISPKIQAMILKKYPTDLATGFKLGEFRGAVVAEVQR